MLLVVEDKAPGATARSLMVSFVDLLSAASKKDNTLYNQINLRKTA